MDYFKVKVSREDLNEGKVKKINETYIIDAFTYTEAEVIINKIISENGMENAKIKSMQPVNYSEVFGENLTETDESYAWYKCKILIADMDTGKYKKHIMLVEGQSLSDGVSRLKKYMADTMADWDSVAIEKTNILSVLRK